MVGIGIGNVEDIISKLKEPAREPLINGLFPRKLVDEGAERSIRNLRNAENGDGYKPKYSPGQNGFQPLVVRISDAVYVAPDGRYAEVDRRLRKAGIAYYKQKMDT